MALLGFLQQEVLPGGLGVAQLWPGLARGSQASAHAWSDKDRTGTETGHRDGAIKFFEPVFETALALTTSATHAGSETRYEL